MIKAEEMIEYVISMDYHTVSYSGTFLVPHSKFQYKTNYFL